MARIKLRCIMGCPGLKSSYREKDLLAEYKQKSKENLHTDMKQK